MSMEPYYDMVIKTMSDRIRSLENQLESHKSLWGGTEFETLAERYKALEDEYYEIRDKYKKAISITDWLIIRISEQDGLISKLFTKELIDSGDYKKLEDAFETISDTLGSYAAKKDETHKEAQ